MAQTIYRWLSLLTLLTFVGVIPATAEEGQIYTIKKGDTLWGLSQRFIDDPYYWPNVWADNPKITNPHLIFPGQKIRILDGKLEIIPAYPEAKQEAPPIPATEPAAQPAEPQPEIVTIKSTGSGDGFILTSERPLGVLVDSVDNRVLLTKNDLVFVKMQNPAEVTVGDTYGLFSRGEEIHHPVSGQKVGTMMNNLGFLQITEINGATATAKIGDVYREITRGAKLFAYAPPRKDLVLQPAGAELQGHIVATRDGKVAQGANDVVFIDLGSDDQVASGNLFYISRPRQVSDELLTKAGDIDLPDEVLGAGVIIEASNQTSSALIIKSVNAMYTGDRISLVSE